MATSNIQTNSVVNIIFIAAVLVVLLYGLFRRFSSNTAQDGPLLAAQGMLGTTGLTGLSTGTISGLPYSLMTNDAGSVMVLVQLGHNTTMHLLAYGDKSKLGPVVIGSISNKWLEPVSLEGDFPDYFHMYVSPEKQVEVREVFAPDVMEQFEDFCRAYDLEIFHESLYISQAADARDTNDQTTLVTDITNFLQHNAAMLQRL